MPKSLRNLAACCLLISLSLPAAAGRKPVVPVAVEQALDTIDKDRSTAVDLLQSALERAKRTDRTWLLLHLAEQHRLLDDTLAARTHFLDALSSKGSLHAHDAARLGLALLDVAANPTENTWKTLEQTAPGDALDTQNASRFLLLAQRATANQLEGADDYATQAQTYAASDPLQNIQLAAAIETLQKTGAALATTDSEGVPNQEGGASPWQAARLALASGDRAAAREAAERVRANTPDAQTLAALDLFEEAVEGVDVQPDKIGILLPLSGRYSGVGKRLQQAIEHGWSQQETRQQLIFTDSGGTPETAAGAVRDLVLEQGVIALAGPILGTETDTVVSMADAMGVPLLTMSQSLDSVADHEWVLQGWLTPRQQIDVLLDYAMTHKGFSSFAIFAPDSDYGKQAADTFTTQVEARGGRVAIRTDYEAKTSNHIPFAKTLGQKNPRDEEAVPVLDFDAIFLPDNARQVPIAGAALAYEEFPVGRFAPTKDSVPVPLMGLSGWNDYTLIAAGGQYTRDGFFTDIFVPPPSQDGYTWQGPPVWTEVDTAFFESTGRHPTPLEILAVDIGLTLAQAATDVPTSRAAFRAALLGAELSGSATGASGFDPNHRVLRRRIEVLSVTGKGFDPVAP